MQYEDLSITGWEVDSDDTLVPARAVVVQAAVSIATQLPAATSLNCEVRNHDVLVRQPRQRR
jgi:hypothetical protein